MAKASEAQLRQDPAAEMQVDSRDEAGEEDLYTKLKTLQRQLEFLEIQVRQQGTDVGRQGQGGRQRPQHDRGKGRWWLRQSGAALGLTARGKKRLVEGAT